jgi:hypothetical protein
LNNNLSNTISDYYYWRILTGEFSHGKKYDESPAQLNVLLHGFFASFQGTRDKGKSFDEFYT